ncbi:MAG TPA: hypothetical protein VFV39_09865 [Limnobacter sp.]|nr:hypothetical protein [Limnobacter sp.]
MTEPIRLDLNFSGALPLTHYIKTNTPAPRAVAGNSLARAVFGFAPPDDQPTASGPCALAVLLDYHEIGWNHLPRARDGHPDNPSYLQEIVRWMEPGAQANAVLDTTPEALLNALGKAGLVAHWYRGVDATQADELYVQLLEQELAHGRPVISLLCNQGTSATRGQGAKLAWNVVWKVSAQTVWTKSPRARDTNVAWGLDGFLNMLRTPYPGLTHCAITVERPPSVL